MKTLSQSLRVPYGISSRLWPILLTLTYLLLASWLPAQPSLGVVSYGGQITGMITVSDELLQQTNQEVDQLAGTLADHLYAKAYVVGVRCDVLNDSRQAPVTAKPKVTYIGTKNGDHRYEYQIGVVSKTGIFHSSDPPLDVYQPYQVGILDIRYAPNSIMVLRFTSSFETLGVAFLTTCDRTFEDYNFTASRYGLK